MIRSGIPLALAGAWLLSTAQAADIDKVQTKDCLLPGESGYGLQGMECGPTEAERNRKRQFEAWCWESSWFRLLNSDCPKETFQKGNR